jgi:hypothetical protein
MARRRNAAAVDPLADLARKLEVLEREMATQRAALEKLKAMGAPRQVHTPPARTTPSGVRRSA